MTTSDKSWSTKLREIGEYERSDHSHLRADDHCVYFGEYTPTGDSGKPAWSLSKANDILVNLKKPVSRRGTVQWRHKLNAIRLLGQLIRENLREGDLQKLTFVPAPPSTSEGGPGHDPRMLQVAQAIDDDIDVRPILETITTREPASQSDTARSVSRLKANIRINEEEAARLPAPKQIIVLDDMVTTG
ncbi:MAG: hypothetical protein OXC38_08635 [Gammaproteobacteria bacterium]|nr:hypothetical protein [Gammaproteobacteria bacterium]